jgi:hypothetical protein
MNKSKSCPKNSGQLNQRPGLTILTDQENEFSLESEFFGWPNRVTKFQHK